MKIPHLTSALPERSPSRPAAHIVYHVSLTLLSLLAMLAAIGVYAKAAPESWRAGAAEIAAP